jgi:glycerol 2-dehydrogenase (NADP+)
MLTCYSTLGGELQGGKNPVLTHPIFLEISSAHNCSPAVVSLSWAVQRDVIVIPKSSSVSRMEENIGLVTLTDQEMESINLAHLKLGRVRLSDIIPGMRYNFKGKDTLMGWSVQDFGFEDSEGNWLC